MSWSRCSSGRNRPTSARKRHAPRRAISRRSCEAAAVTPLESAAILLVILLVLLTGGVWIAISLAAVAWFGLHFFTNTPPAVNLFQSFLGSSASWTLAALPLVVWALLNPEKTPKADATYTLREKLYRSRLLVPCILLIVFIVWVMVIGWATATEAAAYGVLGAIIIAWWSGGLNWNSFSASLMGATRLSCMILFILAGASFLSSCMAFTGIPRVLAEWVASLNPNPYGLIAILALIYIILGTALDGVSMIVLTTSVVIPMVEKAGFDLVWFSIFIVLLVEIAELTPPLGFNIFVLQTMTGRDSNYVAWASLPFFFMMVLCVVLITLFPALCTWLPDVLIGATRR